MINKIPLTQFDFSELYDYAKVTAPDSTLEFAGNAAINIVEDKTGYALRDLEVTVSGYYSNFYLPYVEQDDSFTPILLIDNEVANFDEYFTQVGDAIIPIVNYPKDVIISFVYKYRAKPIADISLLKLLAYRLATYFYDNRTIEVPADISAELRKIKRWRI